MDPNPFPLIPHNTCVIEPPDLPCAHGPNDTTIPWVLLTLATLVRAPYLLQLSQHFVSLFPAFVQNHSEPSPETLPGTEYIQVSMETLPEDSVGHPTAIPGEAPQGSHTQQEGRPRLLPTGHLQLQNRNPNFTRKPALWYSLSLCILDYS